MNAQVLELKILESKQEQTEWCWVAATQSLLAYYGCWLKQCEIAEFARQSHTIKNSSFATSFENPTPLPLKVSPVLILYPNPNSGVFQLETNFSLSDIAHLKVTNLLGGPVYETKSLTSNSIQLPASASGYHFVVIILKDGTVLTQKMMVRR